MLKKLPILIFLGTPFALLAQENKDKGEFIEYSNEFYQEITDGIKEFETPKKKPYSAFKMDHSGKDIPKSVDEFTTVWCNLPISQGNTGTCWCFSTSSYFESEVFRLTQKEVKLSELYTVYWEYVEKAREYVQTRGTSFFGEGSETNAVTRMMKQYGVVPLATYNGLKEGQKFHNHEQMFAEMEHYLESVKTTGAWNEAQVLGNIKAIMEYYIGVPPTTVKIEEKELTPQQYLKEVLQLNMDDYVNFMSLKEKPFYTKAEYNVPDNWWNSTDYNNVPLADFMAILKSAVKSGYSIVIGGDVSESGYNSHSEAAMIPDYDIPSQYINDDARQLRFTNGSTTDDHAIHLIGYKETKKDFWFLIKDSGSGARNGKNKGYYFYHEDFVKLKTMSFTIHKNAVETILKKIK